MNVTQADIPRTVPNPAKYQRYNASEKGKARRETYMPKRREQSLERYLTREFLAWDGEGITEVDGSHTYVLLANSDGESLSRREGLSTIEVFEMFLAARSGVTHIIYGGGYDINMILRDVDRESLEELYGAGRVTWLDYRLEWRNGKSFSVRTRNRSFLLYDVLPFFQCSFVKACDEYLGTDWEYRDEIIREKANRGHFDFKDLGVISEYNRAELSTLVRLADELRERLHKVEIRVKRWDGPGAIASALYTKYDVKSSLRETPPMVTEAGRYAYAGGRFEIVRKGHSTSGAYQYDIRSAYPAAITHLPCLTHGEWRHEHFPTDIARFGVYRIEVITPPTQGPTQPQPLWMRNKNGTVYFAEYSHGWYWTPEAEIAKELGGSVIHEGYIYDVQCDCEPFGFVEPLYNKRAALKRAGDGAHVGLKLGLNSLYGKLAQQIGAQYDVDTQVWKLPPYHSLEWAGYITSHCRAKVFRASLHAPDDILAFETDAVFSRVPLPLAIGERLGEWEETEYASLTYLKSGMYFGTLANGKEIEKTRGINKGTITRSDMVDALHRERQGEEPILHAEQTRFITLGQALHQDFAKWRRWITAPREITVALNGKRIDLLDQADMRKETGDGWEETQEGFHDTEFSYQYPVAWSDSEQAARFAEERLMDAETYD